MAIDRLAAMRNNVSTNSYPTQVSYPPGQGYEMEDVGNSKTHLALTPPQGDMPAFYATISSIQDSLRTFNDNVARISDLHSQSLNNMDDAAAQRNAAQLDGLIEDTRALSATLKKRIKVLEAERGRGRDGQIQQQQTAHVKTKFVEAIQNYQSVEQQYRTKYKQRMERQFKIVKPDATPEEVKAVVNDEQGGQIFSQALMNSRYTDSRAAYREVQERHEDIKRIERTLGELAGLFNDLAVIVDQQGQIVDDAYEQVLVAENHTEEGKIHLEKAEASARAARKKRWICFFIILVILAVAAIIIGVYVSRAVANNKNKNSS